MHRTISIAALAFVLTACGSGGEGGGSTSPVTPPSPPSPPPPTYKKYSELTGDQTFRTACGSLALTGVPFQPRGTTAFGNGLTLTYAASSDTYGVSGDGVVANYGPADKDPAAPTGSQRYLKVVNGYTERFSIAQPSVSGVALDYMRAFGLTVRTPSFPSPVQYSCIFGVPTLVGDTPAGSNIPFARVAFNGAAYVNENGTLQSYSLSGSTATFAANVTNGVITVTLQLVGILQTASGPVGGNMAFGDYRGTGSIDTAQGSFTGSLSDIATSPTVTGPFGGWFFGPQGAEAGSVVILAGTQPGTSRQVTITGTIAAIRQ